MNHIYLKYKNNFLNGDSHKCRAYFEKVGAWLEVGYCDLISGRFDKAYKIFENYSEENTRANWAMFLVRLLTNKISYAPSYFDIRNFLEIDINLFFVYKKFQYIEKILNMAKYLSEYNPETCKYIGRVLWANNYIVESIMYLESAKNILYNDPELHYLLAYICHYETKNDKKAIQCVEECLQILPQYYPAIHLRDIITKN